MYQLLAQTYDIKHVDFLDSNCGRGFARIEDTCLNISHTLATQDEIADKCSEIGATPLITRSDAHYFQMKVSLYSRASLFVFYLIIYKMNLESDCDLCNPSETQWLYGPKNHSLHY